MRSVATLLIVMTFLASCASDTSLPLDVYAEQVSAAAAAYVEESQSISLKYQGDVERKVAELAASDAPDAVEEAFGVVREETVRYLAQLDDTIGRFHDALSGLEPPRDLAVPHRGYVDVVGTVRDTLPALGLAVDGATSIEGIGQVLAESGFADGQAVWVAACSTLEQGIRDLGRGADLKCIRNDVAS
ncbi:MAG: hypothetical protein M5U23_08015 [Acidimicrobiia bacterium]|nr:hypothetical protein [Acidimicrobiia bacterium]